MVVGGSAELTFGPGNRIWYVEKATGEIHTYDMDTAVNRRFFTVSGVDASGERGMLGITLPPTTPRNLSSTSTRRDRSWPAAQSDPST